jgi:hypothetical protein
MPALRERAGRPGGSEEDRDAPEVDEAVLDVGGRIKERAHSEIITLRKETVRAFRLFSVQ